MDFFEKRSAKQHKFIKFTDIHFKPNFKMSLKETNFKKDYIFNFEKSKDYHCPDIKISSNSIIAHINEY